jgi:hypothetical protein
MNLVNYGYYVRTSPLATVACTELHLILIFLPSQTNTLTVALCLGGFIGGVILRYTHRYKFLQLLGLCIKVCRRSFLPSFSSVIFFRRTLPSVSP